MPDVELISGACEQHSCTRRFYKWVDMEGNDTPDPQPTVTARYITKDGARTELPNNAITDADKPTEDSAIKSALKLRSEEGKLILSCPGTCLCSAPKKIEPAHEGNWSSPAVMLSFSVAWQESVAPSSMMISEFTIYARHVDKSGECSPQHEELPVPQ
jgi:hypothetical protein